MRGGLGDRPVLRQMMHDVVMKGRLLADGAREPANELQAPSRARVVRRTGRTDTGWRPACVCGRGLGCSVPLSRRRGDGLPALLRPLADAAPVGVLAETGARCVELQLALQAELR